MVWKKVGLAVQGMEPSKLMERFCDLNQMEFLGKITTPAEV
ncbi:hypothetical protein ACWCL1_01595 [Ligilactobacillus sp. LYQ135]